VNFIDTAGCEALVQASRTMRDSGATLYLCNVKPGVHAAMERSGFLDEFGRDRVWPTKADAVRALYKRFNVAQCYSCDVRIFTECHICLPNGMPRVVQATARP
jgi:SulP family sulfate permease